jgi:hypothetical protein
VPQHTVRAGDCIYSLARRLGFHWQTLWDHPDNSALKERRGDPGCLQPGDVIVVPELRQRRESGATDQRHRFRRKGATVLFRLRLLKEPEAEEQSGEDAAAAEPEPLADVEYVLEVDGVLSRGRTDGEGRIEVAIPPDARRGRLTLEPGAAGERVQELTLGGLDPADEESGVRMRLTNLGYPCAASGEASGSALQEALRAFQRDQGLEVTGEADQETRDRLVSEHGS